MRAVLTLRARADLREALQWIARDSLEAANELNDLVEAAGLHIGNNPAIGSRRPLIAGDDYRFWPLRRQRYVLVYRDRPIPPQIVRIVHMSRDLPSALAELLG